MTTDEAIRVLDTADTLSGYPHNTLHHIAWLAIKSALAASEAARERAENALSLLEGWTPEIKWNHERGYGVRGIQVPGLESWGKTLASAALKAAGIDATRTEQPAMGEGE